MYSTNELLDAFKRKLSIRSDRELALHFGVVPQKISQYRVGEHSLSDERAAEIADACGYDRGVVLLSIWAERAKRQRQEATFSNLVSLIQRLDCQCNAA